MPTINLADDELAAVTAAIRRAIEDDKYPHRASIRCARRWANSRRRESPPASKGPDRDSRQARSANALRLSGRALI